MNKWQDFFDLVYKDEGVMFPVGYWKLIEKSTGKVVGEYKDEEYAKKQARYKFKRIQSKVEKMLLG